MRFDAFWSCRDTGGQRRDGLWQPSLQYGMLFHIYFDFLSIFSCIFAILAVFHAFRSCRDTAGQRRDGLWQHSLQIVCYFTFISIFWVFFKYFRNFRRFSCVMTCLEAAGIQEDKRDGLWQQGGPLLHLLSTRNEEDQPSWVIISFSMQYDNNKEGLSSLSFPFPVAPCFDTRRRDDPSFTPVVFDFDDVIPPPSSFVLTSTPGGVETPPPFLSTHSFSMYKCHRLITVLQFVYNILLCFF